MGYNTHFKGELKFTKELTAKQIVKLNSILGEDLREHPEWGFTHLTHVDLILNEDFTGLKWDDGTEKTYELPEKVNAIIEIMQREWPDFGLEGQLEAQGEEADDRWLLVMENGKAYKKEIKIVLSTDQVICPNCSFAFSIETANKLTNK